MNIPKLLQRAGKHLGAGDAKSADVVLTRILKKQPAHTDALDLAGLAAYQRDDFERAGKLFKRAIKQDPGRAGTHLNLGAVLNSLNQHEAAELHYRAALRLEPGNAIALCNLGKNFLDQNKFLEARHWLQGATSADPRYWIAQHNLGTCLQRLGVIDDAIEAYRRALALNENPASLSELIATLRRTDRFDEEYALAKRLLAMPDAGDVAISAWETLFDAFDWNAIGAARAAMLDLLEAPEGRAECRGSGLILLNSLNEVGTAENYGCHRAWARSLRPQQLSKPTGLDRPTEFSRLKVGYLSPDFREHSIGFLVRNLIGSHDSDRFEIHCYANTSERDRVTDEVIAAAAHYLDVTQMSDAELAARILADQLDILIDLAGHTRDSRLAVMNDRLAPVQITYLGYPNTTGLDTVDYRISDPHVDSNDGTRYSESLLTLPESFLCFGHFDDVERRTQTPAADSGRITFGSFNNIRKITPAVVAAWSEVLKAVPNSRLVIKSRRGGAEITRRHLHLAFTEHGVDPAKVAIRPVLSARNDHLAAYNEIDIALDTFPYHGTTTTCEALWMGVPVVTLVGTTHAQRVSYSILKNLDLDELINWTKDDYVANAVQLARDTARLTHLRGEIRRRLQQSILCDPVRFTRQFEEALIDVAHTRGEKRRAAEVTI